MNQNYGRKNRVFVIPALQKVLLFVMTYLHTWENGYQESWYDNFKTDLGLEFERFETIGEFVEAIHKTINYYNNERVHLSLKTSPAKFKQIFVKKTSRKSVY